MNGALPVSRSAGRRCLFPCSLPYSGLTLSYPLRSECFLGNTLHDASLAPGGDAECDQVCAGASSELCGGTWRIRVYQDMTWFDPNAKQLAAALQDYNDTLSEFHEAAVAYEAALRQWDTVRGPSRLLRLAKRLEARQDVETLTPAQRGALNDIKFNTGRMRAILKELREFLVSYLPRSRVPHLGGPC